MSEPVNVVLAMARVNEEVNFEVEAPDEIDMPAGAELQLRYAYRLYESSQAEDHWTFRLTARLTDDELAVAERTHVDRKLMSDDILSHIGVDLLFPTAGEFTLQWDCAATISRRDWGDKKPPAQVAEGSTSGTIVVRVHA